MRSVAAVVAFVACLHAGSWAALQSQGTAPNVDGPLASVSYAPFEGITHPDDIASRPTPAQIRTDLRTIAPYTQAIRTYSSTGGLEMVPRIAAEFGLKVTVGVWIDKNEDRNEREIRAAIDLARRNSNVNAIVVGNETTLRAEKSVDELVALINRVKKMSPVPVTTGETWDVWLGEDSRLERLYSGDELRAAKEKKLAEAYKLASAVDFIAAHILPYWDRVTYKQAVDHTINIYYRLRQTHPGKKVVIAEFGWPSAGYNRSVSEPGRIEQASVLREFVARADALGFDYNVIEAFDQPWKTFEGSVGSYWGLFDTSRHAKFSWTGPIGNTDYWKLAVIAVAVGFLVSLPILTIAGATVPQAVILGAASHAVGAWASTVFDYWNGHYFVIGAALALFVGLALLVPLVLIALARIDEIAAVLFGRTPLRILAPTAAPMENPPKVSIHIPAYMEPPEMLKQTLDSLARLDYPNYECVVVINNTPDPEYWQPIEEHCRALGERFKFFNVPRLDGYKAGALRYALSQTAPDAEIIGVIDADYTVHANWLKDLVPAFAADPLVGLIQAPQDHRDESKSPLHWAMNGEYAGFFDIGMVQRNEANAIIVHGTMCLIRRAALVSAGGWSSDTICEDTDLGLSILEQGWSAQYTNRRYGHGLLPDTFDAYKKQRNRWAYGGLQIVRKHWRRFLPGMSRLSGDQKREFAIGWLNWLGAESIGVLVALANLFWVPVVAFVGIAIPDKVLTLPIMVAFAVAVLHFVTLYRRRVAVPPRQMAAAMLAAMSMQWTVARAVARGVITEHLPFVRTAKGGSARRHVTFPAFYEAVIGFLLVIGAALVMWTNYEHVREVNLFAWVLIVQSLPFLAAAALGWFEDTRYNSFAFWKGAEGRIADLLPQPAPQPAAPAENRIEAAQ